MDFCPECGEILVISDVEGQKSKLFYKCIKCNKIYPSVDKNYLLFRDTPVEKIYKDACDDITNIRKKISCPTCKKTTIAVLIRAPETLQNIYICCTCRNQLTNFLSASR